MDSLNASFSSDEDDPRQDSNDTFNDDEHFHFSDGVVPSMNPTRTASRDFVQGVKRNEMKRLVAMKKVKAKAASRDQNSNN